MEQKQKLEQFKGQSRLPKFAVPKHYDLTLKIDLSACTFLGTVLIKLTVVEPTKFLVLNALELVIKGVWFSSSSCDDQQYRPSDVVLDSDDEILVLVFDEALDVGEGVLGIEFSSILNEQMKGLYRGTYVDEGVKKNMAVTQFEAVDARRCFPCWDEPALKATFKIAVNVPSELTALSNMPVTKEELNGHLKTLYFEESPIMSTYLVAIVVGLFDHVEEETADGILVRVYCPVGKSEKGKFALDVAVKVLDLYAKYFTVPYPLPKLDMVAVPDFAAGAMENYGLITYRECELLYDELHSTAANKQRLVVVVSHEVAHQWFGNLVTMEWWTHLWLNEGFATWISYLAADSLFPEWKIWTQFLEEINNGLHIDALEQSHPIEVDVHHARSIDEIFDAISYKKGCSIIRMLQDYMGDHVFQKSLGLYVKRYACKNARTEDLWGVLSEESGIEVKALMDKWTKQKGYPVLFVKSEDNILEFEQSQFLLSGLHGDGQWIVPVTLSVGSYDRHKKFLLKTKNGRINISELFYSPDGNSSSFQKKSLEIYDKPSWVKVNVEQTGFYRVKYDDKLAALLRKAIENNWLSAADKYGVLDDTYALCEACELPLSSLLTLMEVYKKETDYIVLSRLIEICCFVSKISIDAIPDLVHELNQFLVHLLLFSAEQLGWESVSGHSHLSTMLREQVLVALAGFGHDETEREGLKRFQIFLEDRNTPVLPADTRKAAYLSVMRNVTTANRNGFESLLKLYREADAVQEKTRVLRCFLSCPDQNIVLEGLNLLLSNEIRGQDVIFVFRGIISEGRETAWTWLKENWESILNKCGSGLFTYIVKDIVLPFCSNERADEVEAFFESCANPSIGMTVKQSVEQVRIKAKWVQNIKHEQSLPELVKELASR